VKGLVYVPLAMVLTATAAALTLRATGRVVDLRTFVTAAAIATLSAEAALLPLLLARHSGTAAVSQAALVGTMLHLFLSFALGATAFMMNLVARRDLFLFLLLGFYWISLLFIVIVMVKSIRRSAALTPGKPGTV
jgi:hypothetical protein